jgi:signal transduction histidine kinase
MTMPKLPRCPSLISLASIVVPAAAFALAVRELTLALAAVLTLLWLLYTGLILAVEHARARLEAQQRAMRERTAALEMLSAQMLRAEEIQKKRLAAGLHEGLAQTLVGIKVGLEGTLGQTPALSNGEALAAMLPVLQGAIDDVRAIATGLRPSSLDELGLVPTIGWFCRRFEERHPSIRIEPAIALTEGDAPAPLKIVIFRIVESLFRNIARYQDTDRIRLSLALASGSIALEVDGSPRGASHAARAVRDVGADLQAYFAEAQERAMLSGGSFHASRSAAGGLVLRAAWPA